MDLERLVVRQCLRLVGLVSGIQRLNMRDELTMNGGLISGVGVEW